MIPGVTKSNTGIEEINWNIRGQIYLPKQKSDTSMAWHATLPKGTFVPPHIHPTQDEFIYVLEGRFDVLLNGVETYAEPGDLIRTELSCKYTRGSLERLAEAAGLEIRQWFVDERDWFGLALLRPSPK